MWETLSLCLIISILVRSTRYSWLSSGYSHVPPSKASLTVWAEQNAETENRIGPSEELNSISGFSRLPTTTAKIN